MGTGMWGPANKDKGMKNNWVFLWYDKYGNFTKLELHDKTEQEAVQEATYFGWRKPRWWQYWIKELHYSY